MSGLERYSPDVVLAHFGVLAVRLLPVCRAKGLRAGRVVLVDANPSRIGHVGLRPESRLATLV